MSTPERKQLTVEIKDGDKGEVSALFARFDVKDHDGDVTLKGAFEDGVSAPISAWGHESWFGEMPVGRGKIRQTDEGAVFEGKFFMSTMRGREAFATVKEMGDLQQWSYGFDITEAAAPDEKQRQNGVVRVLKKLKVHEVSPVLLGAGVDTQTLSVKQQKPEPEKTEPTPGVILMADELEPIAPGVTDALTRLGFKGFDRSWMFNWDAIPGGIQSVLKSATGIMAWADTSETSTMLPAERKAFAAWLHYECSGSWPPSKADELKKQGAKEFARLQRTRASLIDFRHYR